MDLWIGVLNGMVVSVLTMVLVAGVVQDVAVGFMVIRGGCLKALMCMNMAVGVKKFFARFPLLPWNLGAGVFLCIVNIVGVAGW